MENKKKSFKKYKIAVKGKEYEVDGEKKTYWNDLGVMTVFSDQEIQKDLSINIELFHIPNTKIYGFPIDYKKNGIQPNALPKIDRSVAVNESEINF